MRFAYTYVLLCADGSWYIGSTSDLTRRLRQHEAGESDNTRKRLPVTLVYYEACRCLDSARQRERQLKTGYGHGYLNRRLAFEKTPSIGSSQPKARSLLDGPPS